MYGTTDGWSIAANADSDILSVAGDKSYALQTSNFTCSASRKMLKNQVTQQEEEGALTTR